MQTLGLLVGLTFIVATRGASQIPLDSLASGSHVRVTAPALRLSDHPNVLDSLRRDTLFLRQFYVPAEKIVRLETLAGRLSSSEGASRGAKGGVRSGAFIGLAVLAIGLVSDSRDCGDCMISSTVVALYALPVFVGVGAIGGAVLGSVRPPERWVRVQLSPVRSP